MLLETIRLALRAIVRNKLRSFLTVLGVVIGVAAVIAMVTIGQGSSAQVSANVASLGNNVLSIRPGADRGGMGARDESRAFTPRDAEALASLSSLARIAPTVTKSVTAVFGAANADTSVTGTSSDYLEVYGWTLTAGRAFGDSEERSGAAVCILGETVRKHLFDTAEALGATLRIKNISCNVIGLLAAKGSGSFGQDQDDLILMPLRTVQRRLAGNQEVAGIAVTTAKGVSTTRATNDITALMRERRRIPDGAEADFTIRDMAQIASMLSSINNVLASLLSSVAAVSLLVGGIGIMNIMLVSVTERTREIGIRLAVGASASQVMLQFLVEAVVLSVLGGGVGILVGLAIAFAGARVMAIPFAPQPDVVALAFGFSALVGVVFGYFPARRAARLDPIEALRHQ